MTFPVRKLGQYGIITDLNPYDLPANAWSDGNNVRFHEGKVQRAPIFRTVSRSITPDEPAFLFGVYPEGSPDFLVYADLEGALYKWESNGTETDVTPDDLEATSSYLPFTGCTLADVVFINRKTAQPWHLKPLDGKFSALPGWDASWTCRALRSYKSYLVALNVTKGSVEHPTLVKWSNEASQDAPPTSWDHTDPTVSSGENPLVEMTTEILDGAALGNDFFIYGTEEVFRMVHIGGRFVFDFRKAFSEGGVINTNCVVEVNGWHYVFGSSDIYRHNGSTKESIAAERVLDSIFQTMNENERQKFFVTHNKRTKEILFCYVSGDKDVTWDSTARCNRAAVYNYANDTWGFIDLPSVSGATYAAINQTLNWDTSTVSWDNIGSTWYKQEDGGDRHLVMVSCQDPNHGFTAAKILGLDPLENGTTLTYPEDDETLCDAFVERVGIDLDEFGAEIRGYKVCSRLYPQANTFSAPSILVETGASIYSGQEPKWGPQVSFDPSRQYKVDVRKGGRYLSLRFTMKDNRDFEVSGYDADIALTGRR